MQRLSYEDSWRQLQKSCFEEGEPPPIPAHLPQEDDEKPLGISFFRTVVGDNDNFDNLTLPRTFFGRCQIENVSFRNTDFTESNFSWNDFVNVDFESANLAKSDMRNC